MFNFAVDVIGLDSLQNDWNAVVETVTETAGPAILKAAEAGFAAAAGSVPSASGKLKKSGRARLTKRMRNEVWGEVRWWEPYASYSDEGTKPHIIRPKSNAAVGPLNQGQKRKRGSANVALKFSSGGGEERFANYVNHPGQKAQHWSAKVVPTVTDVLIEEIGIAFERAAQRLQLRRMGLAV